MTSETGRATDAPLFGVAAEFGGADALLAGVRALRAGDFGTLETHTPIPIRGLGAALGVGGSLTPFAVVGAALGFAATMGLCLYATAVDYVFDVGGRPLVSWPAFMVPSLSFGMLTGTLAALVAMLVTNRLPRLNHPAFNIPNITRASQDRFFLTITPRDAPLDLDGIAAALHGLAVEPLAVVTVPR